MAPGIEALSDFIAPGPPRVTVTPAATPHCCTALIVEVRRLVRLPSILLNVRENLPELSWGVTLMHGPRNAEDLWLTTDRSLKRRIVNGEIRLVPLPAVYMASGSALGTREWFNRWARTSSFWLHASLETQHVMLFEADTVLCPQPSVPIEWWVGKYAYVGAPWREHLGAGMFWCHKMACCVGNSGLSLWNRELMRQLWTHHDWPDTDPSYRFLDLWASIRFQEQGALGKLNVSGASVPAVPSADVAAAFSWELTAGNLIAGVQAHVAWSELAVANESLRWRRTQSWVPVGVHGVKWEKGHPWPACSPLVPRTGRAHKRCVELLRSCPPIVQILANRSLDGELGMFNVTM